MKRSLVAIITILMLALAPTSALASESILSEAEQLSLKSILTCIKYVGEGVDKKPTIQVSGCNIQVVNGEGTTNTTNGEGNLILGYDESTHGQSGSHDLVLGNEQRYSGYASIIGGNANTDSGNNSVVFGFENEVSGSESLVSGGALNIASGSQSSVTGGAHNKASGSKSSVTGGEFNEATSGESSVTGGSNNIASGGGWTTVSGGQKNTAKGTRNAILGGHEENPWAEGEEWKTFPE